MTWLKKNLPIIIVLLVAFVLRFVNLGYSNYQGDEIKALYLPDANQSVWQYLFDQRKGPVQFIITASLKFINPSYNNELLMRLPFAIAGFLSVYFFYKLIKHHFGDRVAFFASLFLATNGFFVAFARIVQYQSFVILFMILALYMFSLKKYYWAFIFWAISILSHYDGVFIAPFVLYLVYSDIKNKHLWLSGLLGSLMLAVFYIPFVLSITETTKSYWLGRIGGTGGKISSTKYLFEVYQPIYVLHFYTLLSVLGITRILTMLSIFSKSAPFINLRKVFSKTNFKYYALLLWLAIPALFLEVFIEIPGTHIYTYLLPLFVVAGFGADFIYQVLIKILKPSLGVTLFYIGVSALFLFIFAQSYGIFVDHTQEYPWEDEKFFFWTFAKPSSVYHLSLFGFPYYRHWDEIHAFVLDHPEVKNYSCNERSSIARYFVPLTKNSTSPLFYVNIARPQSFLDGSLNEKVKDWTRLYEPELSYYDKNGVLQSEVYLIPQGFIEDLPVEQAISYPGKLRSDWKERVQKAVTELKSQLSEPIED